MGCDEARLCCGRALVPRAHGLRMIASASSRSSVKVVRPSRVVETWSGPPRASASVSQPRVAKKPPVGGLGGEAGDAFFFVFGAESQTPGQICHLDPKFEPFLRSTQVSQVKTEGGTPPQGSGAKPWYFSETAQILAPSGKLGQEFATQPKKQPRSAPAGRARSAPFYCR